MPLSVESRERDETPWSAHEARRASPRHAAKVRVRCALAADHAAASPWSVPVRNLSTHGIGLLVPKAPGLGQLLDIDLARRDGAFVRKVLARVVHEARESSQSFFAGAAFVKEMDDENLRFFEAGAVHPTGPD